MFDGGGERSSVMDMLSLRCMLDIQVEISNEQFKI